MVRCRGRVGRQVLREDHVGAQFVQVLLEEAEEHLRLLLAALSMVSRLAGRATWAMGLVPLLRSFIDGLWSVAAELRGQARRGDQGAGSRHRKTLGRNEPAVETMRARMSLLWVREFLRRRIGAGELGRSVDIHEWHGGPHIRITTDVSPRGIGGILEVDGTLEAFFADTQADVQEMGVEIGKSKSHAALRSDSAAALGVVVSGGSSKPAINQIVREVALGVASSRYGIDFAAQRDG